MSFQIRPERPRDEALIPSLLDRTFGPDRQARTVYRLREGVAPIDSLRFAATAVATTAVAIAASTAASTAVHGGGGAMLASLRFWPIRIGSTPAILLGPLAVEPALQGRGIGRALVAHGLAEAARHGHRICVVVGEPDYYGPHGFVNAPARGLKLPGPVDPRRFQVAELAPGALAGAFEGEDGMIGRAGEAVAATLRGTA